MIPEDILANILSCFSQALVGTMGGSPADACITAGPPAIVECCNGFAWVRMVRAYLTTTFPAFASTPQACPQNIWAIDVELGITRCAPAPCDAAGAVCCDAHDTAQSIMMSDFAAMRNLWLCGCTGIDPKDMVIGPIVPYGPEGGFYGLKQTATIRSLPN